MDGGNDTLNQGGDCATVSDADIIDGGDGIDTISYSDRTSDLTVNLNVGPGGSPRPGNGDLSCAENDSFFNYLGTSPTVENAVLGTANDTFWGTLQNNTVWPNGGQNTLNGCGTGAVPDVGCAAGTNGIDAGEDLRHGLRQRGCDDQPRWRWSDQRQPGLDQSVYATPSARVALTTSSVPIRSPAPTGRTP